MENIPQQVKDPNLSPAASSSSDSAHHHVMTGTSPKAGLSPPHNPSSGSDVESSDDLFENRAKTQDENKEPAQRASLPADLVPPSSQDNDQDRAEYATTIVKDDLSSRISQIASTRNQLAVAVASLPFAERQRYFAADKDKTRADEATEGIEAVRTFTPQVNRLVAKLL